MVTKACSKCHEVLPPNHFSLNRRAPDGYHRWCKACCAAAQQGYYQRRKATATKPAATKVCTRCQVQRDHAAFSLDRGSPDGLFSWCKACQRERQQERYQRTREAQIAQAIAWQKSNPEKAAASRERYYARHTDRYRFLRRRAKARAKGAMDLSLTFAEWQAIVAQTDGQCFYCRTAPATDLDHIVPLSAGGQHTKENVLPSCRACNRRKGNQPFAVFATPGGGRAP